MIRLQRLMEVAKMAKLSALMKRKDFSTWKLFLDFVFKVGKK